MVFNRQSHPDFTWHCMGVVPPFLELSTSQKIKGTRTCGLAMTGLVLIWRPEKKLSIIQSNVHSVWVNFMLQQARIHPTQLALYPFQTHSQLYRIPRAATPQGITTKHRVANTPWLNFCYVLFWKRCNGILSKNITSWHNSGRSRKSSR